MLKLKKTSSKKSSKDLGSDKPVAKYHSYETFPAKVFFDVRDTKNYQLMRPRPSVSTEDLERIFLDVYEAHFKAVENPDASRWIQLRNRVMECEAVILTIKQVLHLMWYETPPDCWLEPRFLNERNLLIEALNAFLQTPISTDIPFIEELNRVLNQEIGILNDEISFAKSEMELIQGEERQEIYNFYKEITTLEEIYGRTLDEEMMLPKYDQIKKRALEKNNQARQAQMTSK